MNRFQANEEVPMPIQKSTKRSKREQVARTQAVRAKRNSDAAENALIALESAASGTENLLPRILIAVEAHATIGEISNRLRKVWGEYRESVTI